MRNLVHRHRTVVALLGVAVLSLVLSACVELGEAPSGAADSRKTSSATTAAPSAGGTTVIEGAAEVELRPVGDSGASGTVDFDKVDTLGVQVELQVSGLPETPGSGYYAQVHEGECVDNTGENTHEHGAVGYPFALVRLDELVSETSEYAHGGHDGTRPSDELPGKIDQPITVVGSVDGTASVTSLLEGVSLERIFSGEPKYLDLHATNSEDAPILACADLRDSSSSSTSHG